MSQRELILRLIKHIPEKHFRMIRYFGFLANRVVGQKLPQVRKALGQEETPPVKKVTFSYAEPDPAEYRPVQLHPVRSENGIQSSLAAVKLNELIANALRTVMQGRSV